MPDPLSHESEQSDEDHDGAQMSEANTRKRSSRACDQCRKTKSKCERFQGDDAPCKSCSVAGVACTFLGPSHKRGPPKGYIHAIEQRWHQVESILGAILSSSDPQVQTLITNLRKDDLARDILNRVDSGPFGPSGRSNHSVAVTKEDFFTSIMNSEASRDPSRPKRQSRVSREIVSSNNSMLVSPTLEWQDRLSSRLATISSSSALHDFHDPALASLMGPRGPQRRRTDQGPVAQPDWDRMYRIDNKSDTEEESDAPASGFGQLSLDENKEIRYHGSASGLPLLYNTPRTDDRKLGGIWNMPMARVWPPAAQQFIAEESVNVNLPPVEVQRHLLNLYFTYVHPVFPVVHKTHFWLQFEAARYPHSEPTSPADKPHMSNLLLLSMFAVAARYDHDDAMPTLPGQMWEAGLEYMVQAREVLNRVYHYSRPSTCQALLLLGLREFGLGSMEHGWLYIGMGLRMAQDLGLNRDAANWQVNGGKLFSPIELQARRQIWWACNRADKHTAVWMGRQPTISESNYDTQMPEIDSDELWKPHQIDPASANFTPIPGRTLEVFRLAGMLGNIVGYIVEKIYPIHPVTHITKRAALAEMEARLDKWYHDLPETVTYDASSKRPAPPPTVLLMHITYWNAVLLLHRAFIPKWRPPNQRMAKGTRESDAVCLKSFDICQSAATHITTIVMAYQHQYSLRRGALLLTQHVFAAGIMHVVTLTMRPSNVQASINLQRILSALNEMAIIWPSAHRAWDLLHGAKVHVDNGLLASYNATGERKRIAEDAFGTDDRPTTMLQREALAKSPSPSVPTDDASNRILAQMLGLDIPGLEPSTSYLPGYEWWPRNGSGPSSGAPTRGSTASAAVSTPSPQSSHSSPPSSMPIPFGFDQTQGIWMEGLMSAPVPEGYPPVDYSATFNTWS